MRLSLILIFLAFLIGLSGCNARERDFHVTRTLSKDPRIFADDFVDDLIHRRDAETYVVMANDFRRVTSEIDYVENMNHMFSVYGAPLQCDFRKVDEIQPVSEGSTGLKVWYDCRTLKYELGIPFLYVDLGCRYSDCVVERLQS